MSAERWQGRMYSILSAKDEIDQVTVALLGGRRAVFSDISLRTPSFVPAELGFYRMVSWLYVLYYEAGKVGVRFLSDYLQAYILDTDGRHEIHYRMVHDLRTYFQHNLDPTSDNSHGLHKGCEQWFREACGTAVPVDDTHWEGCLEALLDAARSFLGVINDCVRRIEADESRGEIVRQWEFRLDRYHSPHEFDTLIWQVAADMGHEHVDVVPFRKRFYPKWIKQLSTLNGDYEFAVEARKLIEHALLSELEHMLPITGSDIITAFDLVPGPRVRELLEIAGRLYRDRPSGKYELIQRIRETITTESETVGSTRRERVGQDVCTSASAMVNQTSKKRGKREV